MSKDAPHGLKIELGDGWILIQVRVQPRSSSEGIAGVVDGALKVRLTAPPVEGKANLALQAFLAKRLHITKRDVEIVAGEASRTKRVRFHGVSPETLRSSLPELSALWEKPRAG